MDVFCKYITEKRKCRTNQSTLKGGTFFLSNYTFMLRVVTYISFGSTMLNHPSKLETKNQF